MRIPSAVTPVSPAPDEPRLRVLIGIPCAPYVGVMWLRQILGWISDSGTHLDVGVVWSESANHSVNLSRILETARADADLSFLILLETDVVPQISLRETVALLLEHHGQGRHVIVTGLQLASHDWAFVPEGDNPSATHWFPVRYANLGFLGVSRQALHALKPIFSFVDPRGDIPIYAVDADRDNSGVRVGLDYSFSIRCAEVGYPQVVDPRLRSVHLKPVGLRSWGFEDVAAD